MRFRFLLAVTVVALGCGSEPQTPAKDAPAVGSASVAGMYEVRGTTTEKTSGATREIGGTVILAQRGDRYTASFSLTTSFPTADGVTQADVIGQGEGSIKGSVLDGKAETQLVMAGVPGVDTHFAFVPRVVGKRIVSDMTGQLKEDGTLVVQTDNNPGEGEDYRPTRTVVSGKRVK